jgi:hypothetical protein
MSQPYRKLIYALPVLAAWIYLSAPHPALHRPEHNTEALQMATTTCGFRMLDENGDPIVGCVIETHIARKGQSPFTLQGLRTSAIRVEPGRSSKDRRRIPSVEVCDTVDLGPNPRVVSGCRFHIGVGDRPLHRVVTLLTSDDGRHFTPIAHYRANGARSVFGRHRYWRLQYPFTGNRAPRRRPIPAGLGQCHSNNRQRAYLRAPALQQDIWKRSARSDFALSEWHWG